MIGKTNIANSSSELYADCNITKAIYDTFEAIDYIHNEYEKKPINIKLFKPSNEVYVLAEYNISLNYVSLKVSFKREDCEFIPGDNGEVIASVYGESYGCALLHYESDTPLEKIEFSFANNCLVNNINQIYVSTPAQIIYIR